MGIACGAEQSNQRIANNEKATLRNAKIGMISSFTIAFIWEGSEKLILKRGECAIIPFMESGMGWKPLICKCNNTNTSAPHLHIFCMCVKIGNDCPAASVIVDFLLNDPFTLVGWAATCTALC